jgi:iron complex outermembrane receptor protein
MLLCGTLLQASAQQLNDTIKLPVFEITEIVLPKTPYLNKRVSSPMLKQELTRDLGDYLRNTPNVSGIRKGGGAIDPVIRGYKFSQINVVIDGGMKIENGCPNRMDPATSHIEIEDLSGIDVIKGPYQLSQGQALGGTINLETENPVPFAKWEIHGNALLGYESNRNGGKEHFTLYGGNSKVYFRLSGGYREYDDYTSGNNGDSARVFNTSFKKYNYSAKLGWSPTSNQSIIASYQEVHGRNVMFPALAMDEVSDDTKMFSVDYSLKNLPGKLNFVNAKLYHTKVDHLMDNSERETWKSKQMVADVDASYTGGKASAGITNNNSKIETGFDFESIKKDGVRTMRMLMMGNMVTKKFNLWKDAQINNAGVFAIYNTSIGHYMLMASLRGDYNSAKSEDTLKLIKDNVSYFDKTSSVHFNWSANVGITRKLGDRFTLSLAAARGSRNANMLERYIKLLSVGYDTYDYLGNPLLDPEINHEIDFTITYASAKTGKLYANLFHSWVKDYISAKWLAPSIIMPATVGAPGVKQFVNVPLAIFKGFEFGYSSPDDRKLFVNIIAAITSGTFPETTKYLITNGKVSGDTLIKNDAVPEIPPFETTVTVGYNFMKGKVKPKISYRYAAAQKHISEAFYEAETPSFSIINASVNVQISKNISVLAGVNNLLDKAYYEHLNRKIIGTTDKLFEPGRLFFINLNVGI